MKMKKAIPASLALFLTLMFSSCDTGGDGEYEFSDWDQDDNKMLDEKEFYTAYTETKYHNRWDVDQDTFIDQKEWETGVSSYWVAYDIGEYGAFTSLDPDVEGRVPEQHFREKIFEFYDKDGDGHLNKEEYQTWYGE